MLTDKALTDFNKWLENGNHTPWVVFFDNLPDTVKNAYYIEWFDTVGININITPVTYRNWVSVKFLHGIIANDNNTYESHFNRQEATKQALIMANEIYNSKK